MVNCRALFLSVGLNLLLLLGCAHHPDPEVLPPVDQTDPSVARLKLPTLPSRCPDFSATYLMTDKEGQIKKGRFESSSQKISFPDSENLMADGKPHLLAGSTNIQYVVECFTGAVDIKVSRVGGKPFRFVHYQITPAVIRDQTITFTSTPDKATGLDVEEYEWKLAPRHPSAR